MRALVIALVAASLAGARADADCHEDEHEADPWLSPGITLGLGNDGHGARGFFVGGELSVLELFSTTPCSLIPIPDAKWIGGYVDGVYYTSDGTARWTIGPEVGWDIFGLDGGLVLRRERGKLSTGVAVRGVLTVAYVQVYLRAEDSQTEEGGVLLKWPIGVPRHP